MGNMNTALQTIDLRLPIGSLEAYLYYVNQIPVIAQQTGADTAAVIYDAMAAAQARNIDILLADTAGRLHTQSNLMAELHKVKRVLTKLDPTAPHEVLIVLDATLGQNALNQVKQFHQAIGVTGLVVTKLDRTPQGGILFAISHRTCVHAIKLFIKK